MLGIAIERILTTLLLDSSKKQFIKHKRKLDMLEEGTNNHVSPRKRVKDATVTKVNLLSVGHFPIT